MRILITGAAGLVGRAVAESFREKHDVFPAGHAELDITDERKVAEAVSRTKPDLIVNCAVIGVDDCERDPVLARQINVEGPALLAREASLGGAAILHFSTNYVFGGERTDGGFYSPADEAVPINEYGRTKLEGENRVRGECSESWIVRTSWVFGKGKDSFLATVPAKLRSGQPVIAIDDVFASSTWVYDLAGSLATLVESRDYGIHHITNEGVSSHAEFAETAGRLLGMQESEIERLIVHRSEAGMNRVAPRPRWTPMTDIRPPGGLPPLRPWQDSLDSYIRQEVRRDA